MYVFKSCLVMCDFCPLIPLSREIWRDFFAGLCCWKLWMAIETFPDGRSISIRGCCLSKLSKLSRRMANDVSTLSFCSQNQKPLQYFYILLLWLLQPYPNLCQFQMQSKMTCLNVPGLKCMCNSKAAGQFALRFTIIPAVSFHQSCSAVFSSTMFSPCFDFGETSPTTFDVFFSDSPPWRCGIEGSTTLVERYDLYIICSFCGRSIENP